MLVKGSKVELYVTHVESRVSNPGVCYFWAQIDLDAYSKLETMMAGLDRSSCPPAKLPISEGDILLAQYSDDGRIYRAQVSPSKENPAYASKIDVLFIDFGNTERVSVSDLLQPQPLLYTMQPLAIRMTLDGVVPQNRQTWTKQELLSLQERLVNKYFTAEVVEEGLGGAFPPLMKLIQSNDDEDIKLLSNLLSRKQKLEVGECYDVRIVHAVSQLEFWVNLTKMQSLLDKLHTEIHAEVKRQHCRLDPSLLHSGNLCIAKYGKTDYYSRAVVVAVNLEMKACQVLFIDFGNSDFIGFEFIFPMAAKFARLPIQAIHCSLTGHMAELGPAQFRAMMGSSQIVVRVKSLSPPERHLVEILPSSNQHSPPMVGSTTVTKPYEQSIARPGVPLKQGESKPGIPYHWKFNPILIEESPIAVCISHVEGDGTFYCQMLVHAAKLDELMYQINHTTLVQMKGILFDDTPCLVRSPLDKSIYRSQVLTSKVDSVVVKLVDFGTMFELPHSELYIMPDAFLNYPTQAIHCALYGAEKIQDATIVSVLSRYNSKVQLVGRVMCKTPTNIMELTDTTMMTRILILDLVKIEVSRHESIFHPPLFEIHLMQPKIINLTTVVRSNRFFGRSVNYDDQVYRTFQARLNQFYSSQSQSVANLTRVAEGMFCCAEYFAHKTFHRACVVGQMTGLWLVEFIDIGTQELKDALSLKVLHPEFCFYPQQGFFFEWTKELSCISDLGQQTLMRILENRHVAVMAHEKTVNGYIVSLPKCDANTEVLTMLESALSKPNSALPIASSVTSHGSSVTSHVKEHPVMKENHVESAAAGIPFVETTLPSGEWLTGVVSHVENPGNFFVRWPTSEDTLAELMEEIGKYISQMPPGIGAVQKVSLGMPVLAKYSEDQVWYRAKVTGILKVAHKYEVQFVDYGNRSSIDNNDLREITRKFMALPIQAFNCSLDGISSNSHLWSDSDIDKFFAMVNDVEIKICHMGHKDQEGLYLVHLLNGQENVNRTFLRSMKRLSSNYVSPVILDNQSAVKQNFQRSSEVSPVGTDGSLNKSYPEDRSRNANHERVERGNVPNSYAPAPKSAYSPQFKEVNGVENARSFGAAARSEAPMNRRPDQAMGHVAATISEARPQKMHQLKNLSYRCQDKFDCIVTYIVDPGHFYCQSKDTAALDELSDRLNAEYSDPDKCVPLQPQLAVPGSICCAKYSADDLWYRAKILSVKGSNKAQLQFVDYGNEESQSISELKYLQEKYFALPVQAVLCSLAGIESATGSWSEESTVMVEELGTAEDFRATVLDLDSKRSCYKIDLTLISEGESVQSKLVKAGHARLTNVSKPAAAVATASACLKYSSLSLRAGTEADVYLCYIENPGNFWCQLDSELDNLEAMMNQFRECYDKLGPNEQALRSPTVGQICAAKYSEDDQWYRAEVVKVDNSKILVHFVDYGNTDWVTSSSNLKIISPEFCKMSSQGVRCAVAGIFPLKSEWSEDSNAAFEELAMDKKLCMTMISPKNGEPSLVKLVDKDGNVDVGREMVKRGMATETNSEDSSDTTSTTCTSTESSPGRLGTKAFGSQLNTAYTQFPIKVGSVCKVIASWVTSPSEFYCQMIDENKVIERLSTQLYNDYHPLKMKESALTNPECGQACVAFYEVDGNWYRAQVVSVDGDDASVLYVDYGNVEKLRVVKLKQLTDKFTKIPVQSFKCCLAGAESMNKDWKKEIREQFDTILGNPVQCKFVQKSGEMHLVELRTQDGKNLNEMFLGNVQPKQLEPAPILPSSSPVMQQKPEPNLNNQKTQSVQKPESVSANQPAYSELPLPGVGDLLKIDVMYVDHKGRFYCHEVGKTDLLDSMMNDLAECYTTPKNKLPKAALGLPCAAKFVDDESWYRAKIIKIDLPDTVLVKFVDYGNSQKCSADDLCILETKFLELPIQCRQCELSGLSSSADNICDRLDELILGKQYDATVVSTLGRVLQVNLVDETGADVRKQLGEELFSQPEENVHIVETVAVTPSTEKVSTSTELALPRADIPQGECEVWISNAVSPSEFYVQLKDSEDVLYALADKLQTDYHPFRKVPDHGLQKVEVGALCCARFSEDEAYYRAVVEKVEENNATVRFVDYGNQDCLPFSELKDLFNEHINIPAFAFKCVLDGCELERVWNEEDVEKFVDLATNQDKTFVCKFVSNQQPFRVILKDGEENVATLFGIPISSESVAQDENKVNFSEDAVEETVEEAVETTALPSSEQLPLVVVSHVNSANDFYVQMVDKLDELEVVAGNLQAFEAEHTAPEELTVGLICAGRYSADETWYRALIKEICSDGSYTVQFVDYGNEETVEIDSLATLSQSVSEMPYFAVHCKLDALSSANVDGDSAECGDALTTETADKELGVVFVDEEDPRSVRLFDGSVNILTRILASLGVETEQIQKEDVLVESADPSSVVPDDENTEPSGESIEAATENGIPPENELHPDGAEITTLCDYRKPDIESGKYQVLVTHVNSVDSIFLQLTRNSFELEKLLDKLDEKYSYLAGDGLELLNATVGQACCIKHSNVYYRGKIIEKTDDSFCVRLVDIGSMRNVRASDLKRLDPDLMDLPPLVFECSLAGKRPKLDDENELDEAEKLLSLMDKKVLTADVHHSSNKDLRLVVLWDNDSNLNSILFGLSEAELKDILEKDDAESSETVGNHSEETVMKIFITHAESPDNFWCHQAEPTNSELPLLMDKIEDIYLNAADTEHQITHPEVDMQCVAKYSDGVWYRARILSVESETVNVLFFDYGNSSDVSFADIRIMTPECMEAPPMAIQCSLSGLEPCGVEWDEASLNRFIELTTYDENKQFEFIISGDHSTVTSGSKVLCGRLKDDEMDIGEELVKEGYAVNVVERHDDALVEVHTIEVNIVEDVATESEHNATVGEADERLNVFVRFGNDEIANSQEEEEPDKEYEDGSQNKLIDDISGAGDYSESVENSVEQCAGMKLELGNGDILHAADDECVIPDEFEVCEFGEEGENDEASQVFHDSFIEFSKDKCDSLGDLTGIASNILTSDSAAFPYLQLGVNDELAVVIASSTGTDSYVCHPLDSKDDLDLLMSKIDNLYIGDEKMISLTEPEVEQPCAICLESSRRWCRGEIMKLLDDGFVEVHAVDYGETRRLPLTEVRLLEQEFLALPVQALHLHITFDENSQDLNVGDSIRVSVVETASIETTIPSPTITVKFLDFHPSRIAANSEQTGESTKAVTLESVRTNEEDEIVECEPGTNEEEVLESIPKDEMNADEDVKDEDDVQMDRLEGEDLEIAQTAEEIEEDKSEEIKEDVNGEIKEDISEEIKEDISDEIKEDISEEIKEDTNEEIKEDTSEEIKENTSEEIDEESQVIEETDKCEEIKVEGDEGEIEEIGKDEEIVFNEEIEGNKSEEIEDKHEETEEDKCEEIEEDKREDIEGDKHEEIEGDKCEEIEEDKHEGIEEFKHEEIEGDKHEETEEDKCEEIEEDKLEEIEDDVHEEIEGDEREKVDEDKKIDIEGICKDEEEDLSFKEESSPRIEKTSSAEKREFFNDEYNEDADCSVINEDDTDVIACATDLKRIMNVESCNLADSMHKSKDIASDSIIEEGVMSEPFQQFENELKQEFGDDADLNAAKEKQCEGDEIGDGDEQIKSISDDAKEPKNLQTSGDKNSESEVTDGSRFHDAQQELPVESTRGEDLDDTEDDPSLYADPDNSMQAFSDENVVVLSESCQSEPLRPDIEHSQPLPSNELNPAEEATLEVVGQESDARNNCEPDDRF